MSLKAQLEAIIYATETPITLEHLAQLVKPSMIAAGAVDDADVKSRVRSTLEELVGEYDGPNHGVEIRQVAGGYRMSTKPEQHEMVRSFAKSLKPPVRLSLPALETLAVIAYKQPVTVPEIAEIRGVDSGGVIGTLLDRKLITTAGRKQVIGRPILYKTTKEFLMRFGLKDVNELPSMEEFEKLVAESFQSELIPAESAAAHADDESVKSAVGATDESESAADDSEPAGVADADKPEETEAEEIKKSAAPAED
jgi:segregation and condensation protein B